MNFPQRPLRSSSRDQLAQAPLADVINPRPLHRRETVFSGHIFDLLRDEFSLEPGGDPMSRDFMRHPGAVAIAAVNDRHELLMINQHRHPLDTDFWEIPAGLLDQEGESPLQAAQRELLEETDLQADTWHTLMEFDNSPGCSTEANRIYLARDLSPVPESERIPREAEEAEIIRRWVPLEEAVTAVLESRLHSPASNHAILAVWAGLQRGFRDLQDPEAPWPAHPRFRGSGGSSNSSQPSGLSGSQDSAGPADEGEQSVVEPGRL